MNVFQKIALLTLCVVALTKLFDDELQTRRVNQLRIASSRTLDSDGNDQEERPVMHTFYEHKEEGEDSLLEVWAIEWNRAGFDTKVLSMADARAHPYFEEMEKIIKPILGELYNGLCFYRWLAMVQAGGGWMSDYDVLPTNFPIEDGLVLPNGGNFTSFQAHVPCLMSGSQEEWSRVTHLLMDAFPRSIEKFGYPTDMRAFMILEGEQQSHNIDIDYNIYFGWPYRDMRTGFQYKEPRIIDCEIMKIGRAVHLSHKDTDKAYKQGLFPVKIPRGDSPSRQHRGEAGKTLLEDWRSQCQAEIQEVKEQNLSVI